MHELSPGRHHGDAEDHSHHGGDDGADRGSGDTIIVISMHDA